MPSLTNQGLFALGSGCKPKRPKGPGTVKKSKRKSKPETGRWREKKGPPAEPGVILYPLTFPLPFSTSLPTDQIIPSRLDRIVDTSGLLQEWDNPCNHVVVKNNTRPPSAQTDFFGTVVTTDPGGPKPDAEMALVGMPFPDAESQMKASSFARRQMETIIPKRAQLLGSLFEMIANWKGMYERARDLWNRYVRQTRVFWVKLKSLLDEGLDQATAWDLAWQFAIAPLLGDFVALRCSVEYAQRQLRWLVDHNHIPYRTYARRKGGFKPTLGTEITIGGPGQFYEGYWVGGPGGFTPTGHDIPALYKATLVSYSADYHASSTAVFHLELYKLDTYNVWSQQLGLYDLTGALWEATPGSFLLDWFSSVIKNLTEVADSNITPFRNPATLTNVCSSWKITAVWDVHCVNSGTGVREYLGPIVIKRYVRNPGLVTDPRFFTDPFKLPTRGDQLAAGAALAWQRNPRKWRRYVSVKVRVPR